jgi:hypothetical protein
LVIFWRAAGGPNGRDGLQVWESNKDNGLEQTRADLMATPTVSVVPPLQQLDTKHQTAMKSLISTVIRSFYDPKHLIMVDILMRHHMCGAWRILF